MGGITSAASSTITTGVGANVVVVEDVVVVSSITGAEEVPSAEHADIINENIVKTTETFFLLVTLNDNFNTDCYMLLANIMLDCYL